MSTPVIDVFIWGKAVGAVAPDPVSGSHVFEYDPKWVRGRVELSPLHMPTAATPPRFAFPALGDSFHRLPGLLSDALPDQFGNGLIDAWLSRRGESVAAITALDRLAYMGKRGIGALEFRPPLGSEKESSKPLEMKGLVETARNVLQGDFAGDKHAQAALANIIRVGTSAGGARAKAVVAWNPSTQQLRSGQFDVPAGFEHWLLKFDGVGLDQELGTTEHYGRIEYAYHLMAKKAGIEMEPCRLLEENGRAHFMTRRFDRDGNKKHHVQTLCGLAHMDYRQRATHAYEQLFTVARQLGLPDRALNQLFRRMVFNVVARNCDDHTKNFAFLLREGSQWELAPAYDVTHAHNPNGPWTNQHLMSVNGKFDDVTRADFLNVGERFVIPDVRAAVDEVVHAVRSAWTFAANEAQLPADVQTKVVRDFRPV